MTKNTTKPDRIDELSSFRTEWDYRDEGGAEAPKGSRALSQTMTFYAHEEYFFMVTLTALKFPGDRLMPTWGCWMTIRGDVEGCGKVERRIELGDFYSVKFVRKLFKMIAKAEWSDDPYTWRTWNPLLSVDANHSAREEIVSQDHADHEARFEARLDNRDARRKAKWAAERKAFEEKMASFDRD